MLNFSGNPTPEDLDLAASLLIKQQLPQAIELIPAPSQLNNWCFNAAEEQFSGHLVTAEGDRMAWHLRRGATGWEPSTKPLEFAELSDRLLSAAELNQTAPSVLRYLLQHGEKGYKDGIDEIRSWRWNEAEQAFEGVFVDRRPGADRAFSFTIANRGGEWLRSFQMQAESGRSNFAEDDLLTNSEWDAIANAVGSDPSIAEAMAALDRAAETLEDVEFAEFAEQITVTDREVLAVLQQQLETQTGALDRLIGVTLDDDAGIFRGQASQKISSGRSQTYEFQISPNLIVYRLVDADAITEFAESESGWAAIVEFAAKSGGTRSSKKLNCKPGNIQCGGKCQKGGMNCRINPPSDQQSSIASIAKKAKASKATSARQIADDLAKDPKIKQFISLITSSRKSDKKILEEIGLSQQEGLQLVNKIRRDLGVRPDQRLKDRLIEIYAPSKAQSGDVEFAEPTDPLSGLDAQGQRDLIDVLNEVYQDGVERVVGAKLDSDGSIRVVFEDVNGAIVRRFAGKIEDLDGEPIVTFKLASEGAASFSEHDFAPKKSTVAAKKKNCTPGKSISCGASCISLKKTCRSTQPVSDKAKAKTKSVKAKLEKTASPATKPEATTNSAKLDENHVLSLNPRMKANSIDEALDSINTPGAKERVQQFREFANKQGVQTVFYDMAQLNSTNQEAELAKRLRNLDFADDPQIRAVLENRDVDVSDFTTQKGRNTIAEGLLEPFGLTGFTSDAQHFVWVTTNSREDGELSTNERRFQVNPETLRRNIENSIQKAENGNPNWGTSEDDDVGYDADSKAFTVYVHEMGHQVAYTAGLDRLPDGVRSLTEYSRTNNDEWFAEHFAAWMIDANSYRRFDPIGADFIEQKFEAARNANRRFN